MTKKTVLGATAVIMALALTGSALVASNMGFKLNYNLVGAGAQSVQGDNPFALPDNRKTGLNDAKNLMDDIGSPSVLAISKYLKAGNAFQSYTGRKSSPGPNFSLAAGEGYWVKVSADTPYVVAGSDDPAAPYGFTAPCGGPCDGTNFFAYNYHQTASTSKSLMDDIGSANVQAVSKYVRSSNAFLSYTGRKSSPSPDFAIAVGDAYYVKVSTAVNYVPSHY